MQSKQFQCECGKAYLTFGALYVHIARKHPTWGVHKNTLGKRVVRK